MKKVLLSDIERELIKTLRKMNSRKLSEPKPPRRPPHIGDEEESEDEEDEEEAKKRTPQGGSYIHLSSDGSIEITGPSLHQVKKVALELHKRQVRRYSGLDYFR
ncbi:MAG: hypothetical protein WC861_01145 [Candidatus Micrarchaeia archaeon]|jgi:hypothetical protein